MVALACQNADPTQGEPAMTDELPTPADAVPLPKPRPPLVLRGLSGLGVLVLLLQWLLPLAGLATFSVLVNGARALGADASATLDEARVASSLVVAGAFALFVVGAVVLSRILNMLAEPGAKPRSGLAWGALAWLIALPAELLVSALAADLDGAKVGVVLWASVLCALVAVWLAMTFAGALWRLGGRSTAGAAGIAIAALLLVVIPDAALGLLPTVLEQLQAADNPLMPIQRAFASGAPSAAGLRRGGGSVGSNGDLGTVLALASGDGGDELHACYDELVGDGCEQVWQRARNALAGRDRQPEDALHGAFLYVCASRKMRAPASCGTFWLKAYGLSTAALQYTHYYRDEPNFPPPTCPMPTPDTQAMSQQELDLLEHARAQLPERSRYILDLAYRDGLTDAQIGAKLGLSTVRVRVVRREAENELQGKLQDCR
jgi:RNA polymerase sigma factor (sigma-70 family)